MSGATHYCAFHGDSKLKTDMVDRVRVKWTQRLAFPLSYLKWRTDGGIVSLSGTLAETQVPEQFVERTGLPLELATLCETKDFRDWMDDQIDGYAPAFKVYAPVA